MSAPGQILYLKIGQNCIVQQNIVRISDIAEMECPDRNVLQRVGRTVLCRFSDTDKKDSAMVCSILQIMELIHREFPLLEIISLGETDFVIRYIPKTEKQWLQYLKVAILSVLLFFGSAFSIMTFIQDAAVAELFDRLYDRVTGNRGEGINVLEVSFCIGIFVGIMFFYNHAGRKKIMEDPTPIQVAIRKYEQDVETTYIAAGMRKGKSADGKPRGT